MNIKDACRYQNFLTSTITTLQYYVQNQNNVMKTEEKHLRKNVNTDVEDEVKNTTPEREYNCGIEKIVTFISQLIDEKLNVSTAIENAKRSYLLNWKENNVNLTLDTAIEYNKNIHEFTKKLKTLVDLKGSETKTYGTDYKFNAEGNQMPYKYPVEVVKTIDYDRNTVKELYKKLLTKTDKISTEIDEVMGKNIVAYEPQFDIHDSVEELLANLQ
ncbi:MAG: hypothetical protein GX660_13850 [Clostridiaceae bacterium]|nr:hypothetical protein [Clostridiaceae bacterium]